MSVGSCPYGGQWWSCTDQHPSFEGCCSTYPCLGDNTGCPDDDLYPAVYASAAATTTTTSSSSASSTMTTSSASTSSTSQSLTTSRSTTTSTSSSQTNSSTASISSSHRSSFTTSLSLSRTTATAASQISLPTSAPTLTSTPSSSPSPSRSLSKTQIIGGSVGGGVLIFLLCALVLSWYWSKRSRKAHTCQSLLRTALSPSPSPSEMSERQSPQPTHRTLLPYLQTNLSNGPQKQRIRSSYSAYSANHITSSTFDSPYSSGEQLVGSGGLRTRHSEEAYYPGQPVFGVSHANNPPGAVAQSRRSLPFEHQRPEVIAQPRRSLLSEHQRPSSEAVAQRRRSPLSQYQRPSPPPVYVSRQHSPTSPVSPTTAPAGAPNSERRSSAQQYESRPRPQLMVPTMQPDHGLGLHDPRRRSEPAPKQYIYETPDSVGDRVPELPFPITAGIPQRTTKTRGLRVKTMSGSAVGASTAPDGRRWGPSNAEASVEGIKAAGASPGRWGGDMRTSWEKERDLLRERERQMVGRTSYTRLQVVNP